MQGIQVIPEIIVTRIQVQDIPEIIVTRIQVGAIELEWKQDTKTGKVDDTVGGIFDNISDCRL